MASFKAIFPVLQELFAKNHRGALWPSPSGARINIEILLADVTKPEKSNPCFDLTCVVISDLQVKFLTLYQ